MLLHSNPLLSWHIGHILNFFFYTIGFWLKCIFKNLLTYLMRWTLREWWSRWKSVLFQRQTVPSTSKVPGTFPAQETLLFTHAPPPLPNQAPLQAPPPHFLSQRVVPICRHVGHYPSPWCIGPVGAARWYWLLFQRLIHEEFFPPNELPSEQSPELRGGGHLSPSLCRISELLQNFFACRHFAITRLFSNMKKRKTITVQIS